MKTQKTISVLTTATTVLLHAMNMVEFAIRNGDEDEAQEDVVRSVTGEAPHSILSYPADIVRELLDELGDDLLPEDIQDLRSNLYPHKYKGDYTKFAPHVNKVFHFAHDLGSEMHAARKKFDFNHD